MPMFDDPRQALNRLQRQLLEEEEEYDEHEEYEEEYLTEEEWLDEEIAQARALAGMDEEEEYEEPETYRNYANGYGRRPLYDEDYADVEEEEEESYPVDDTRGQRILTFLLVCGILAVAGYWAVMLL